MKPIEEGVFLTISRMEKILRRQYAEAVAEYRFTPNEIAVLMFLFHNPALDTASDVARYKNISKSLVAKSVESLCRKGYLTARRDDLDRRLVHLRLSEQSGEIAARLQQCKKKFTDRLEQGIPREYIDIMDRVSVMMEENLNSMLKGNDPF